MRVFSWLPILLAATLAYGESADSGAAYDLYQRTEYDRSLSQLLALQEKDAAALELIGRNYYMLAEFRKATDYLEKAYELKPNDAGVLLWLGRAWGRRAETSNFLAAPGYATKARQFFEKSLVIDPNNHEAVGDLFDFYLEAPGFLGGGQNKAQALAERVAKTDPPEGYYYLAQLEQRRNAYDAAERHLRAAMEMAPHQVGRFLDLAKFLAKRGRVKESDAIFEKASEIAPGNPRVLIERAGVLIEEHRNPDEARRLLYRYLKAPLTPEDPPRHHAEELLKKIGA